MVLQAGNLKYNWNSKWAKIDSANGFAHHGMAVSKDGNIVTAHDQESKIIILDSAGNQIKSFAVPVVENHCIHVAQEGDREHIWIADTGSKGKTKEAAQVIKVDFDGKVIDKITKKDLPYTNEQVFTPTAVAIEPKTNNIWITDGYGSNRIFCLSPKHELLVTINGNEGSAGAFSCPHWIYFDQRKESVELYIADRSNNRIQVYDTKGNFKRVLTEGLRKPSGFTGFGSYLVVAELTARVVVLDEKDQIVGYLGAGQHHTKKKGWPNRKVDDDSQAQAPTDLPDGEFNSPHGIAADKSGNIYVSEWLLGDRFVKLEKIN